MARLIRPVRMRSRRAPARRGVIVLIVVVVLAVLNVAVLSTAAASGSDAQVGVLRVETVRAFYAAESGSTIVVKGVIGPSSLPAEGSSSSVGSETVVFVQVPSPPGEVIVEGQAGFARRRLSVQIE